MSGDAAPEVSIVVPTRNGAATLGALLDAIDAQRGVPRPELVAIDSGSDDGSVELLAGRVDRLLREERFDHGLTRNRAIAAARGELVVLLVQDAIPASPGWLAALVAPFAADPRLAGAFARQLAPPSAGRLARWALSTWVAAGSAPWTREVAGPEALAAMTPYERFLACVFDNVCSCVRREVWARHLFKPAPIAEDVEWARDVLLAGYRIAYQPEAAVVHCHERPVSAELARTVAIHRRLTALFGLHTVPTRAALVRAVALTLIRHLRVLVAGEGPPPGVREVLRGLGLAVAWPLGQYLGARSADAAHPEAART